VPPGILGCSESQSTWLTEEKVMIIKLENITIDQLADLYQFLEGDINQKAIHAEDPIKDCIIARPFARIMECKASTQGGNQDRKDLPTFQLTLEVKEMDHAEKVEKDAPKEIPVSLGLLAKLMQSLELFPEY
jgi:hypothetical protein